MVHFRAIWLFHRTSAFVPFVFISGCEDHGRNDGIPEASVRTQAYQEHDAGTDCHWNDRYRVLWANAFGFIRFDRRGVLLRYVETLPVAVDIL